MTLLIVFPLISLASFVVLARYIAKLPYATLGAGFVMWITWTGLCGRVFSVIDSLQVLPLWLLAETIPSLIISVIVWKKISEFTRLIRDDLHLIARSIVTSAKSVWIIPFALIAVGTLYSIGLAANIKLPQTMDDSVTAYLARAGFWISNQSTAFFRTSDYNFPLVSYPALPTFSTLRWIVISGGDHAAAFDQWLATLISGSLLFSLARKVGASVSIALLGALLWLLMPVTLLQSQMVLNDMVALVAVLTTIILVVSVYTDFRRVNFLIAVLALLVAAGTKQTVLFMAPSAIVAVVVGTVVSRKSHLGKEVLLACKSVLGILTLIVGLLLAAPEYISNILRYQHPLGPEESFGYFADVSAGFGDRILGIVRNLSQVFFAGLFGDVPRSFADYFLSFYEKIREQYQLAGTEIDRAMGIGWFGFSVTVLIVFCVPVAVILAILKRPSTSTVLLSVSAAIYSLFFMYTRSNFSQAFSRYMLFPFTLFLIVSLLLIEKLWVVPKYPFGTWMKQSVLAGFFLVAILQGSWSFLGNGLRPLAGANQVWSKSDNDIMYLSSGFVDNGAFVPMIEKLNSCHDASKALGIYLPYKFPLSLLFGSSYDRKVEMLNIPTGETINLRYFAENKLSTMIIDDVIKPSINFELKGLWSQSFGRYTLLVMPNEKSGCY